MSCSFCFSLNLIFFAFSFDVQCQMQQSLLVEEYVKCYIASLLLFASACIAEYLILGCWNFKTFLFRNFLPISYFFWFILHFTFLDTLESFSYCSMILAFCVVTFSALSLTDQLTSNARRLTSNPRKQEPICEGGNCQISYSCFLQEYTCISPKDIFETYLW